MTYQQGTGTGNTEKDHPKIARSAQTQFKKWVRPALFPLALALVFFIPVIIGLTYYYFEWRNSIERNQVVNSLQPYERTLEAALHENDLLISNLATYIQAELEKQSVFNQQQFNFLAGTVFKSNPAVQSIALIQNQNIRFLRSQAVGDWGSIFGSDESLEGFRSLVSSQPVKMVGPILLKNGQTVIVLQKTICLQNSQCNQVGAIVDMQVLLSGLSINPIGNGISTSIRFLDGAPLWGDPLVFDQDPVIRSFDIQSIRLDIAAVPVDGWGKLSIRSTLVFGVVVTLIGLLLVGFVYLVAIQRDRLEEAVKKRTKELARISNNYQILGKCNQALVRAINDEQLIDDVCKSIVELGLYQAAWVYLRNDNYPSGKYFVAYSKAGEELTLQPG
ncbi:MAG: hypothetical protein HGA86_07590, partial [Anaerolineaceae bacterium]|nr:hypothetical protein [Anaerolineaceae bacterium]